MSENVYTDLDGTKYSCKHLVRKGDKLMHSELCRQYGKTQCPHYKKCSGFIAKVNYINSPSQKYQSMINTIIREHKKRLKKSVDRTHDDLLIKEYANNPLLYALPESEAQEIQRINVSEEVKIQAEFRLMKNEDRVSRIKKSRHLRRRAKELTTTEEEMKEWLAERGIKFETTKEREFKERVKRRKERGIHLETDKVVNKRGRKSKRDLSRYENAVELVWSEGENNVTTEDEGDYSDVPFELIVVTKKGE